MLLRRGRRRSEQQGHETDMLHRAIALQNAATIAQAGHDRPQRNPRRSPGAQRARRLGRRHRPRRLDGAARARGPARAGARGGQGSGGAVRPALVRPLHPRARCRAPSVQWLAAEGGPVAAGMRGLPHRQRRARAAVGRAQRANFLQMLSAVATTTRRYVDAIAGLSPNPQGLRDPRHAQDAARPAPGAEVRGARRRRPATSAWRCGTAS